MMGDVEASVNTLLQHFRHCWPGGLTRDEYSTLNLLALCRTGGLGYNRAKCEGCKTEQWYGSSCGDRHCPQCLGPRQANWSERMCARLPDCPHYHLVFSLPKQTWEFFEDNYRVAANIFFASVAETIQQFLRTNWKCQQGAFFSVLHTWGSALNWHPHLHVLLSAGAVDTRSGHWKVARRRYAFPLRGAMTNVFAAIFLRRLEEADANPSLIWRREQRSVEQRRQWRQGLAQCSWNIFAQPTLNNTRAVVRYLARYTSRIAMSNHRIEQIDEEKQTVSFAYRDYRDEGRIKNMTLSIKAFLHRFSRHLVPRGFHRIRQYGLLVGRVGRFQEVVGAPRQSVGEEAQEPSPPECPHCQGRKWSYDRTHVRLSRDELSSPLPSLSSPVESNEAMGPRSFSLGSIRAGPARLNKSDEH